MLAGTTEGKNPDALLYRLLGDSRAAAAEPSGGGRSARRQSVRCGGQKATIVGTARRDVIRGTRGRDVIAALGGNDVVRGLGGNDVICGGAGTRPAARRRGPRPPDRRAPGRTGDPYR